MGLSPLRALELVAQLTQESHFDGREEVQTSREESSERQESARAEPADPINKAAAGLRSILKDHLASGHGSLH